MLSREPPRQPVGYLHGEHNPLILRFKDPRIAHRERQNRGKTGKNPSSRAALPTPVYTNFFRIAKSARKSKNSARRSSRSAAISTVARK